MRKIVWSMPVSLDGYFEGPNGLDWVIADADLHEYAAVELDAAEALLFGRLTYELFVDFWPKINDQSDEPAFVVRFANAINRPSLQKIVYSKTLDHVDWNGQLVREIVPAEVRALKAQGNGYMAVSGGKIGAAFTRLGLVDELELLVQPVVLGGGKRLFDGIERRLDLKLLRTQTFQSGTVVLRYALSGT